MKDWISALTVVLILLLFIGAGISYDIWRWHKTEEIIGHEMSYREYHMLFGNNGGRR